MKNAIVVLTKGYNKLENYNQLCSRNKHIVDNLLKYTNYGESIDLIIFHEGNITDEHQEYIKKFTPEHSLIFYDIKKTEPKNAFDDNKNIINNELCPPTHLSNAFKIGYKHMCHFWSIDFLSYLKEYKYVFQRPNY